MTTKFKKGQKLIVPNYLINGIRLDMPAEFIRYIHLSPDTYRAEIYLNTTYMVIDESRLVDYDEFVPKKKDE